MALMLWTRPWRRVLSWRCLFGMTTSQTCSGWTPSTPQIPLTRATTEASSKDSGVPKEIETKDAKSHVIFSNIKAGKIGSTTGNSPSPSHTTLSPSSAACCSWDGKYCGKTTDYCGANAEQCEDCKGSWCSDCLPPFTTAAPDTTAAPAGDCPGGSLEACLADCPAAIYKECATSCAARCPSSLVV